MDCPRAVLFDLDDTLAESFKAPAQEMVDALEKLIRLMPVCIVTGAGIPRVREQFADALAARVKGDNFYIFPNSSGEGYRWSGSAWEQLYAQKLSPEDRSRIKEAVAEIVSSHDELRSIVPQGQQLFDRDAQVAYTIVGVDAPLEVKKSWDPNGVKRAMLQSELAKRFPHLAVLMGGTTTIDITPKGIDKAYGVRWISAHLEIAPEEMLYIGDSLFEGGNDAVVIPTGIATRAVANPTETLSVIDELLRSC